MPAEWRDDFCDEEEQSLLRTNGEDIHGKRKKSGGITLRPPLYNAEDYIAALKLLFSSNSHPTKEKEVKGFNLTQNESLLSTVEHQTKNWDSDGLEPPVTPPEMTMRKFLNGSELLFKLEADLRHAYATFVQEFVSVRGVLHMLEALKLIQMGLDEVNGLREQRKLIMDEHKCLQCLYLCLRNIEAVSKLSTYPGGLYPIGAAMVSTVTPNRIIALEILTCICSEGGAEGHFKVSEAISTLRLRLGEPIRCKVLIGAISSSAPGAFQATGIRFLTTWVASAPSPRHKVYIQCELEEAGFSPPTLRKGAELCGAREGRIIEAELEKWDRVSIDVNTLIRQNSQLRNSVATLQQELATLKDKLKRMDPYLSKSDEVRRRSPKSKRQEEIVTTPADSEEEAEQIHQILQDLNNIVNSELNLASKQDTCSSSKPEQNITLALETNIVPTQLVKSPPKNGPMSPLEVTTRPWPGSSASDDDDESDLVQTPSPKMIPKDQSTQFKMRNVKKVGDGNPTKLYFKHGGSKVTPQPQLNFHKQNVIASKFTQFKSSKLYSSGPDNSQVPILSNGFTQSETKKRYGTSVGLRRSESLHASLAFTPSSSADSDPFKVKGAGHMRKVGSLLDQLRSKGQGQLLDKWKSVDDLNMDDNFSLHWKYPDSEVKEGERKVLHEKSKAKEEAGRIPDLFNDYRHSRFSKSYGDLEPYGSPVSTSLFNMSKHSKKLSQGSKGEKEATFKMFSLPPIFVSQGFDLVNHRICDLPSGLY